MPLVLGRAYDQGMEWPWVITGSVALPLFSIFLMLECKMNQAEIRSKWGSSQDLPNGESEQKMLLCLCEEHERLKDLLDDDSSGKAPLTPLDDRKYTQAEACGLGLWMAEMMSSRGYTRWLHQPDGTKSRLMNAFPRIRKNLHREKLEDLMQVYAAHIELNNHWTATFHTDEFCAEVGGIYG